MLSLLVFKAAYVPDCSESKLFSNYQKTLKCRGSLKHPNNWRRQILKKCQAMIQLLKWYSTPATTSYFMKFYFVKWKPFRKWLFFKKTQVKVKPKTKVMLVFAFYLWHHLWQTLGTAANFYCNSSFSRDTRFLISG